MEWIADIDESLLDDEALEFLVRHELDGPAAGIIKDVIKNGLSNLSEKQLYVFKKYVVDEWLTQKCKCGNHKVEPDELIGLWANEGYCVRCVERMEKE
jgi:hypothetical protein